MWRHLHSRPAFLAPLAAAIAASAACASTAGAAPLVTTDPPLHPEFENDTPDYTVRCRRDAAVHIGVRAPAGMRVAIGDGQPRGGSYDTQVGLRRDEAVVIRVIADSTTRVHYVRCLPADFPRYVSRR